MAIEKTGIEHFLELAKLYPVLDVRSPAEFAHAHIPGAQSLALFTDEERKVVGTAYKQQSRETAIKIGLDYFGPKMRGMVEMAETICARQTDGNAAAKKTVLVHCWRGGMRSAGLAWLLDLYGFKVYTLVGGYKKFRHWVLDSFKLPWQFNIAGGYTGSGKTALLYQLEERGAAMVDLEAVASHKGSAFGNLGMPPQPSQEMFENLLAMQLRQHGLQQTIWLEDESQRIGDVNIPGALWQTIRQSPLYFIDIPFEERLQCITGWYGRQDKEKMLNAIIRIKKRLGPLETKTAVNFLIEDNLTESFRVLLNYYDKLYKKSLQLRPPSDATQHFISCSRVDAAANAEKLLQYFNAAEIKTK